MASKIIPWYKRDRGSQVKSDLAYQYSTKRVISLKAAQRKSSSRSRSQAQATATEAMAESEYYTIPVFRQRTREETEGTEEYQRVSTKLEKGLAAIQEELQRMRISTKAQVDSLAIEREVKEKMYRKVDLLEEIPRMPDFIVALRPHTVWEKMPVKLFCTVLGTPRPIVKWYKGGVPVDPLSAPGKYKIESKYGVHSLIISRCVVSDTADYSAVATNSHGTATSAATVTVRRGTGGGWSSQIGIVPRLSGSYFSKLEVSLVHCFPVTFGVEGESASLQCSLVVVPDLPNLLPIIEWYRDEKLLQPGPLVGMSVGGGVANLVLPHLAKDDEGLYTIRVFTKDGTSEHCAYLFVSDATPPVAGAPGAPMSVKAYDISSEYILVAWKPPNTVNEAPITGYFVDRCEVGSDSWVQCNDAPVKVCKYPVQNLKPGHSYQFRVRAVNSAGVSRASRPSHGVTALDAAESTKLEGSHEGVASAPGQPVATRNTKSSVFVQWEAPRHGQEGLMGYYIDARVVGSKDWFACNHKPFKLNRFVVHGLTPGETYVFRVQAVNVFGLSEESQESGPIAVEPALATPSAPYGISLLNCDGSSMTVSWSSPKRCGGSKIIAYYVDRRDVDSLAWKEVNVNGIMDQVCTVDNLTEGTFYEFKVQAANMAGVGLPSAPSLPMKCEAWTMEQPGPAYDLTFSEVRSHSLVLVWKAPVYTGASAVSGYFVDMAKKGSCEFVALNESAITQRYMQVTGLEEGEWYVFRVRTVNGHGIGRPSLVTEAICARPPPGTKEIITGVDEETGDIFLSLEASDISQGSAFVWSKNYKPIGECPRVTVSTKGRTSRLSFMNPDKDDLGRYSVLVTDTDGVSASHTLTEDELNSMLELSHAIRNPIVPLKHGLNYEVLEKGHVRFWAQAVKLSPAVTYRFVVNDKEVTSGEGHKISHDVSTGVIQMIVENFTRDSEGTYTLQIHDGKAKTQSSLVLVGDVFLVGLKEAEFQRREYVRKQGAHFSEYLTFTVNEDCTVMLTCKVANVKKETTFHWYKEDEEIIPETPPNVMSGACALPIPLFSRKDQGVYKAVIGDDRGKDTSIYEISGKIFDDIINAIARLAGESASELVLQCTPEGIRLQCYMTYYTEEMKTVWKHKESKIASSEKMRIGGTSEMAWMQICDPSDKEKGLYTIEISDGVKTHARTFDLSGQAYTDAYEEYLRLKAAAFAEKNRGRVLGGLPDVVTIMEDKSLSLTCTVWGDPTPEVTWFKNEQEVASNEHTRITFDGGKFSSLVINQVTPEDSGKYSINVRNKYGGEFVEITVSVYRHGEQIPDSKMGQTKMATPAVIPPSKTPTPAPSKTQTPTLSMKSSTPASTPKSQTPAPKSPTPAPKSTTPAPKSTTPAPKSPTPAPKSPTPGLKSPTPGLKSPTPAPKSPTPAPKSPTPTPKSPGFKSPTPFGKSPTPVPKSPTPSVKSPTPSRFMKSPTPPRK
ncbi:M-protein, striated muscle isoform X1 [Syngnathoides biaculeatus]|uniref:M-protein, striated muscle isoform X1 n=2 Tax=Syngnathoides biaculeatus TaxID=300417 RepID=UPI002ADE17F8|nr:M-protein, striated muscle isoform X1 [Syngnathoides biaculeatus]XP_061686776.1 M-protein, striated muscle isoform X1 [Syngnathoides biaculeatus]XP_061686777.1 M-protein, striated muscle isoform X1 [Syngnathoides biaculeatus]XP_061686784.1 M-protein, striated muscle isoform X1 [Syngnathoides biaculeatus]